VDELAGAPGGAPQGSKTEYLKHLVVGTPLETVATRARRLRAVYLRKRAPELANIWAEPARIDETVHRLVHPGHNVLDVGAHLGSFTSLVSRLSPQGRHIAIEALPYKADWLRKKFPHVKVENIAVSDSRGTVTFHHNVRRTGYSGIDRHVEAGDEVLEFTVPTTTIDDLVPEGHRIDFAKIDVEGAELRALGGATRMLDEWRPAVLFECTSTTTDESLRKGLFEFFAGRHYRVHMLGDWLSSGAAIDYDAFEAAMRYPFQAFNFLALPEA
jgi:FkbM family methyltransferase